MSRVSSDHEGYSGRVHAYGSHDPCEDDPSAVGESRQSNVEHWSCLEPDSPPLAVIAVQGNRPERLHHVIPQNK